MPGQSMYPSAVIECGMRDAFDVIRVDDSDDLLRSAVSDQQNRPLIVACQAVIQLRDDAVQLRERIADLEAQLRGHGSPST